MFNVLIQKVLRGLDYRKSTVPFHYLNTFTTFAIHDHKTSTLYWIVIFTGTGLGVQLFRSSAMQNLITFCQMLIWIQDFVATESNGVQNIMRNGRLMHVMKQSAYLHSLQRNVWMQIKNICYQIIIIVYNV